MRAWPFIVLVLLGGCLNPDDRLALTGRVAAASATEGQEVRLFRARGGGPFGVCDPTTAEPFRTTTVEADGGFRFDLFRVEAQALTGIGQFCFRVETDFASGSHALTTVGYMNQSRRVATLREWRSGLALDGGTLHFEPVVPWPDETITFDDAGRPRFGVQLSHRAEARTADGGLVWRADDRFPSPQGYQRTPLTVPDFALEDFDARLDLLATLFDGETQLEGIYASGLLSVLLSAERALPLRGQSVPFSRGLPCPELGAPCPLTDGQLDPVDAGFRTSLTLDLGAPRRVQAVVLRGADVVGASFALRLETHDGGTALERSFQNDRSSFDDLRIPSFVLVPAA